MWVLCIGEKNFSSQHSMPLPGTTGIVKHKLLPEKVFGEKKEEKRVPKPPLSQYVLHICIRVHNLFPNKKGFDYHKIICQIKNDYLWFAIFFEFVFDASISKYQ